MKINRDDPKWTAYVLGELDEVQRAEIDRLLESSDEAREFVADLQLATTVLKDELLAAPPALLRPDQRRAIHAAAGAGDRRWTRVRPAVWVAGLAASLLILASVLTPSLLQSRKIAPQGAIGDPALVLLSPPAEGGQASAPVAVTVPQSGEAPPESVAAQSVGDKDETRRTANEAQSKSAGASPSSDLKGSAQSAALSGVAGGSSVQPGEIPRLPSSNKFSRLAESSPAVIAGVIPPPQQNFDQAFVIPIRPEPDRRDSRSQPPFNTEAYDRITDNPFIQVSQSPLATFSIDVDTASYANMRRFLMQNQMPPRDSVRIEELVNYFSYNYPQPTGEHPIAAQMEVASAPWNPQHRLVRIGLKGREMDPARRPSSNLVFLIDVSGSMQPPEKLPLLKSAMKLLVDKLTENDRVSIVVYAGGSGTALSPTTGDKKEVIMAAIDSLRANGSTNGAAGIQLAYNLAVSNFIQGGVNRVVLATDGDFNVGVTNQGDLTRLIEDKAKSGVFLSVFGFGMGNLKDSTLEKLADTGNGNYAYIDSINEARKVLVEEMGATLVTIAKDVKIQIEFNPAQVNAYRLIGYENRLLRDEDFNNDQKDAGDMGSGHTVTALFEVAPVGVDPSVPGVDPLRYQAPRAPAARVVSSREMLNLKVRYKDPDGSQSKLMEVPLVDRGGTFVNASADFRFASSVAAFGMVLRDSPYKGDVGLETILGMAQQSKGADRGGYREEFINLVRRARALK